MAVIVRPPSPKADWQKPIIKYLQIGTIPDDETKTQCLARRAMGYLIHNDELYQCSTLDILRWCIPQRRARRCSSISMRGFAGITLHQQAWSRRLSDKVFTG
jgi:hypothetical protein